MNTKKSIATGVALTMVAGTAAALAMNMNKGSARSQKRKLKKGAARMVRTMGQIVDEVASSMH